ncbi:aminotransferase-like domain-containing protein [Rhodococcoides kyotonense]|uniref:DNA-binding transcriptional regulator, MocR family, contains an aminotransferase domain n=1 Tax=Rhodococcoides kyotonense TaxID=398843 RepID=A0A239K3W1_9NOCA|nr:PLP-dependent aminotransferase family protein [Rhodococcus kyotonensis]SNT12362.1 DNA-binding transcriptional regulator, MocR family, contains an aminotransferase domain [Rhodococcus kyotonensis]
MSAEELAELLGEWRVADGTLSIGLATALAHLVESQQLPSGTRLPAQRSLAEALDIARGTVTTAYEILVGRGYINAEVGRGSTVASGNRRSLRPSEPQTLLAAAVDLSTQSLPASSEIGAALGHLTQSALRPYLETDGHFPFGIPVLRSAIARHLSATGIPTTPDQILVTAGAQQALWLATFALTEPGDGVLVDDPTYRGALAVLDGIRHHLRVVGYPASDPNFAAMPMASLLYCQSSVHSPTGRIPTADALHRLASYAEQRGHVVVDDRSAAELVYDPKHQNTGLHGLVDPSRLLTIGTASKLFWGGLRVGWVRSDPQMINRLTDVKQAIDITTSVVDQFLAVEVLQNAEQAAAERRQLLLEQLDNTIEVVKEVRPEWVWERPSGGSGLWVDIGSDAIEFAMKAQTRGIRVADGPSFSVDHGFETHVRLPVWRGPELLRRALDLVDR